MSKIGFNTRTLIEMVAVILVWRGTWTLLDSYLFPASPEISAGVGIIVGLIILLADDFLLKEISHWIK